MQGFVFIHVVFFAIYPALFFYSRNTWLFNFSDVAIALVEISFFAICVLFLFGKFFVDYGKGALLTSLTLIICFSFGPSIFILKNLLGGNVRIRHVLLFMAIIILSAFYFIFRSKRDFDYLTRILNIVSVSMVFIVSSSIVYGLINFDHGIRSENSISKVENISKINEEQFPDVYYIILDAYAHKEVLRSSFDFLNDDFYSFLQNKGFYIAEDSTSNYSFTLLSLASSLNMRYLDDLKDKYRGEKTTAATTAPLRELINNNEVQRFLKSRGYGFVYMSSGPFVPLSINESADVNFSWDLRMGSFLKNDFLISFLYQFSILEPLYLDRVIQNGFAANGKGVLYVFDRLKEIASQERNKPVLVIAHVLSPHPPFTLNSECLEVDGYKSVEYNEEKKRYLDKLRCTNMLVKEFVESVLVNSKKPPIIVIQSDHGFKSEIQADTFEVLKNFNAFYLPGKGEKILNSSITPVNSFRLIFNHYFGEKYEILRNENWFMPNQNFMYDLVNVTDKF